MIQEQKTSFRRLQESLGDPLLTFLTVLFAVMLFVIAPLRASGIFASEDVGLGVGLIVICTVVFAYGLSPAVVVLVAALTLAAAASVLRHRHQTPLDLYLDASAWVLLGVALSWVVARAVFAPGRITYHRVMGAILLYLTIGVTFVALYTFLGLLVPDAFSGMPLKDSPALPSTQSISASVPSPRLGQAILHRCTQSPEASPTSRQRIRDVRFTAKNGHATAMT